MGMGGNGNRNGFMGMGGNGNRNSPSRTPLVSVLVARRRRIRFAAKFTYRLYRGQTMRQNSQENSTSSCAEPAKTKKMEPVRTRAKMDGDRIGKQAEPREL